MKDFFDKAVAKNKERETKKRDERKEKGDSAPSPAQAADTDVKVEESDNDQDMIMSDVEEAKSKLELLTPATPFDHVAAEGLKRKRGADNYANGSMTNEDDLTPSKRLKSETPPPPPPPPAPADGVYASPTVVSDGVPIGEVDFKRNADADTLAEDKMLKDQDILHELSTGDITPAPPPPPPPPPIDEENNGSGDDHYYLGNAHDRDEEESSGLEGDEPRHSQAVRALG